MKNATQHWADANLKRFGRRWFLTAAGVGALVVGAAVLGTCAVSGFGDPLLTALTVSSAQLCSMLTVLPFFARLRTHETPTPTPERVLQWLMILVVTPAVFWLHDLPGLAFLVIPVLAWGALRASPYEALAQTYAVFAIAMNLTTFGWGPFTDVPIAYDLPVADVEDFQSLAVQSEVDPAVGEHAVAVHHQQFDAARFLDQFRVEGHRRSKISTLWSFHSFPMRARRKTASRRSGSLLMSLRSTTVSARMVSASSVSVRVTTVFHSTACPESPEANRTASPGAIMASRSALRLEMAIRSNC